MHAFVWCHTRTLTPAGGLRVNGVGWVELMESNPAGDSGNTEDYFISRQQDPPYPPSLPLTPDTLFQL